MRSPLRYHRVFAAARAPSEPALSTVSTEKAPLSERTPPPHSPGAPPAPRGPQRPALQTPGLREPGASGVRRTRGGRPRTLPRSLRVWPPPGGGGGAERAQKVRASLQRRCSRRGRGVGKALGGERGAGSWRGGQGRQVSRGGRRPARPTAPFGPTKAPCVSSYATAGSRSRGTRGPRGRVLGLGRAHRSGPGLTTS